MKDTTKTDNKKIFNTVALLLGSIIGAGFASGREIVSFLGDYGYFNIVLMVTIFIFFAITAFSYARLGKLIKAGNITDITKLIFGKFSPIFDVLILFSVFSALSATIAGIDSVAESTIATYSFPWLSIVISLLVVFIVSGGLKRVLRVSSIIIPTIIVTLSITSIYYFATKGINVANINSGLGVGTLSVGVFSALSYAGSNLNATGVLLTQIGDTYTECEAKKSSILFSFLFVVGIILSLLALYSASTAIYSSDMPMIGIAKEISPLLGSFYTIIIFMGIFMTMIAVAFSMTNWLKPHFKNRVVTVIVIMLFGYAVSRMGFGNIIDLFYPIKGATGFVIGIAVSVYYFKNKNKIEQENSGIIAEEIDSDIA
jgi:uncharacterized membrane protein YkvI